MSCRPFVNFLAALIHLSTFCELLGTFGPLVLSCLFSITLYAFNKHNFTLKINQVEISISKVIVYRHVSPFR